MAERASVGLVGIGLLGQALAHRLLGAGFEVAGFDVDPAKNAKLAQLGGRPATSVAYLAERCDPIALAVFTTDRKNPGLAPLSHLNWKDLRDQNDVFSDVRAYDWAGMSISTGGEASLAFGQLVSGNYFDALGVHQPAPDEVPRKYA